MGVKSRVRLSCGPRTRTQNCDSSSCLSYARYALLYHQGLAEILRELDTAKSRCNKLQQKLDDEVEKCTVLEAEHSQQTERLLVAPNNYVVLRRHVNVTL